MSYTPTTGAITENGTYWFSQAIKPGVPAFIEFAWPSGTATVQPVYEDRAGQAQPFRDLDGAAQSFTDPNFVAIDVPKSCKVGIIVSDITDAVIKAALTLKPAQ